MRPGNLNRSRLAKLARMTPDELRTRGAQALTQRWDVFRCRLGRPPAPAIRTAGAHRDPRFFFASQEVPVLIELLRERLPGYAPRTIERADRICEHRFDLLGFEDLRYGPEIDWHLDIVNGRRAPLCPWYKVPSGDFDQVGDAKVTWELNRHNHLVTLAKAYRLSGEQRYVAEIEAQFDHWWKNNPYPFGINWASALEVAFRSLSWLWVKHLLEGSSPGTEKLDQRILAGLSLSGRHLEVYLSTYFSPNTHLLGEAVALFFIGVLAPEIVASKRWLRRGWQIILQEATRQVRADGLHFEKSAHYHVYALDFFLHSRLLADLNGIDGGAELDLTLIRQLDALSTIAHSGAVFRFGDDDGGRLFDGTRNRAEHLLDPLATGATLFGRGDFKALAGGLREETIWLLGSEGVRRFDEITARSPDNRSRALEVSGLYLMGAPTARRVLVSAGSFGLPAGGHGHADLLSLQLAIGDRVVLDDSGTFAYAGAGGSRNTFRGTGAHNTLQIDGRSQADQTGAFSWSNLPSAKVELWVGGETFDLFLGHHDGYSMPGSQATHRRWIFNLKSRFIVVRDVVEGDGAHDLDISWHLARGVELREIDGSSQLASVGREPLLAIVTPENTVWQRSHSEGWASPVYGKREPRPVLTFSTHAHLPAELVTLLDPVVDQSRGCGGVLRELAGAEHSPANVAAYEYEVGSELHLFFYSTGDQGWRLGDCESDATFLYCKMDRQTAQMSEAIVVGGTRVRWGKQLCTAADGSADHWTWDASQREEN